MNAILQPWPWYVAGPLIGLTVPLLLFLSGKSLGISSSFRHFCSILMPRSPLAYIRENNWRAESWNLFFIAGIVVGAFIAAHFLSANTPVFLPASYHSVGGITKLLLGGVLVGFGTRYANGCTSGHTIMGLSNLQWPSLVASICFFIGGLIMTALAIA
ncbi:MAG: YeeE/YedE family protein [Caldilineaceae bacterium]|nr:YeeE/YedE family protein [Caldilineaceae bacterium]